MKYYSEVLNKIFDTEKDLVAEEQKAKAAADAKQKALAEQKAEEEKKIAERKTAAKEIEELTKQREALSKTINQKVRDFVNKYGSFHYSYHSDSIPTTYSVFDIFNDLFNN